MNAAVQFIDELASGCLMEPVDILSHDTDQFSFLFPGSQLHMRSIGFCIERKHLIPVKLEKLLRLCYKECMGQDLLRRIVIFLVIQAVHTAKIGYSAFGGYTGPAEEYDAAAFVYQFLQFFVSHGRTPFFSQAITFRVWPLPRPKLPAGQRGPPERLYPRVRAQNPRRRPAFSGPGSSGRRPPRPARLQGSA